MDSSGERGYNFGSLVWAEKDGAKWTPRATITKDEFQRGCKHRRWVSAIHGLDPVAGRAIIKVAEGDAPLEASTDHYTYSWREWDIQRNRQIRVIRICKDPFEPL